MSDPREDAAFKRALHTNRDKQHMGPEQASELRDLCQQTDNVDLYRKDLTQSEASTLIDRLREKARTR